MRRKRSPRKIQDPLSLTRLGWVEFFTPDLGTSIYFGILGDYDEVSSCNLFLLLGLAACQSEEQAKEERRQKEIIESEKRAVALRAQVQREDEARKKFRAAISDASDIQLNQLFTECEARIREELREKNRPMFDVYFPRYGSSEFRTLVTASFALGVRVGGLNNGLEKDNFEEQRVRTLREFPTKEITVIAQSASDSFSGVKRWGAEYSCALDGLRIVSIRRGQLHFLD